MTAAACKAIVEGIRGYNTSIYFLIFLYKGILLVIYCTLSVITIIFLHHENVRSNTFGAKLSLFELNT